jgi:uncharacterized protein (DUF1800 family)
MDSTLRALNRFGLGARIGERRGIADPRGWLRAQLEGGAPRVAAAADASPGAIGDALRRLRMPGSGDTQARQQARRRLVALATAEYRAALTARVTTERPFVERLVAFWSNHLCVSAGAKILVAPLAGSYEREAIRPHVLGRFEDMVLASAKHPAMLVYLDNFQSVGPGSTAAGAGRRNAAVRRGLNENYARELLELHTLGVNGGYTQQDVQQLARILTGWTIDGLGAGGARGAQARAAARGRARGPRGAAPAPQSMDGRPLTFAFQELLHEPGDKTVLGVRYAEAGVLEGERAIRAFCAHPSTAQFVATKLVSHFVSDDPPAAAVDRIARAFRDSDGDLKVVARALIELPEAWSEGSRKFRTPQEWYIAVVRAFRAERVSDEAPAILRQLRHPLWSPQAPKGFGDAMQEWADPDSLLNRAELARSVARVIGGRAIDPRLLLDVVEVAADNPLPRLLADSSVPVQERVALAIAGPAFQWR